MDGTRAAEGKQVVLLVAQGELAAIAVNGLGRAFPKLVIIEEEAEGKWAILTRRRRLLGLAPAVGQALAGVLQIAIAKLSRPRIEAIHRMGDLDPSPDTVTRRIRVGSVNAAACRDALAELRPDVVAVYGTRIIGRETLACVRAPFINYHAGINPKYRGQHPAYWALRAGDREHAGITIHLVDHGVDTGSILRQQTVAFTARDNIATYQHVQMAAALPCFIDAISAALEGRLETLPASLPSRQWFPPTLWSYVWGGVTKRVW